MPLPHFTQLSNVGSPGGPNTFPDEVVYTNLFEITFVLPSILQAQGRNPILLLENATKIDLNLTEQDVAVKEQRFKYSTRAYLTTPTKTTVEFSIPFQVNVNKAGSMENWNTMRSWWDLVFNSQNGTQHYKSDIIGTIIVNQHDKKGVVLRRVTFQNVQIKKLGGYGLDWGSNAIIENITADFIADYWIDEYVDQGLTLANPLISGY
jgi:hypothetical protein